MLDVESVGSKGLTYGVILFSFTDIDECQTDRNSCHRYATCADVPGDYSCFCKEGFSGNGQTCFGKA